MGISNMKDEIYHEILFVRYLTYHQNYYSCITLRETINIMSHVWIELLKYTVLYLNEMHIGPLCLLQRFEHT